MQESEVLPGHLYVVATPIGNLSDLSPRALKVLAAVDRIAAEDTRTTGAMLEHFGVKRPLVALHEHNEDALAAQLVEKLKGGESLAVVSDAGTPLISDPGFALVRAARAAKIPVIGIPGPCAAIAALSISGLPTDSFLFAGFLPAKTVARRQRLQELAAERRTVILYESSHRIEESLGDIVQVCGARRLCLAREISKRFEESITAPATEVLAWLRADANRLRGEFVLVLAGAAEAVAPEITRAEPTLRVLLRELPPAQAAKLAAELTGVSRHELYALAVKLNR